MKGGPLKGVLPDLGFREYKTTTSDSFVPPNERPEASRLGKKRLRVGMVTPETLSEAAFSYGQGLPAQTRFDTTTTAAAGRTALASETATIPKSSTMREAMALPREYSEAAAQRATKDMTSLYYSQQAPPAGGSGSLRIDRGKKSLKKPGGSDPLVLGEASVDYPERDLRRTVSEEDAAAGAAGREKRKEGRPINQSSAPSHLFACLCRCSL